jgi:hypothetical protein
VTVLGKPEIPELSGEESNLTRNADLTSSGVQYALFIIFTSVIFFFVDKTGRRPLLIYGAIGLGICQFVVGGIMGRYGTNRPWWNW